MNDIIEWLLFWFDKNTEMEIRPNSADLNTNYFEQGWIDSMQFILFINDIESKYNISFSHEEFQNREFATIGGLSDIIKAKIY